jgi:hypothetical protein
MTKTLDDKLARLRVNRTAGDFILADAKDADMAWGIAAPGETWPRRPARPLRSMDEFRDQIREIARQGLVDILLASVATQSVLADREGLFRSSPVTPAVRANDTTDIWMSRGGRYAQQPSLPFRTAVLEEAQAWGCSGAPDTPQAAVDLGLYSITFTNDAARDRESLEAFKAFRRDCAACGFRYFLEVFAPNVACGLTPAKIPAYVNDQIVRALAGVARGQWPLFLKIPYFGPRWMEELAGYDSELIVGVLGGASGTTFEAFNLVAEARQHGARAALFGRRIKDAEHALSFIAHLRRVADGELPPREAVRSYHAELRRLGIPSKRPLKADL